MPAGKLGATSSLAAVVEKLAHQLPLLEAQRAGARLYGAPSFSSFELFLPNENTISRVVADLLDPRGMHGQGALFLNGLLREIGLPTVFASDAVRVRREALTDARRRIDLLIETPEVLLGIENKPWASQGNRQLQDYAEALHGWAGAKQQRLIFLSDQEPEATDGEVIALSYYYAEEGPSLRGILEGTLGSIKAARARFHVTEFIRYIDAEFGEMSVIREEEDAYAEAVVAFLEAPPHHRKAAASFLLSQSRLHAKILDELGAFLLAAVQKIGADFYVDFGSTLSDALAVREEFWGIRRPSWPGNLAIGIEAGKQRFGGVYYGVRAPDPKSSDVKEWPGMACAARAKVEVATRTVAGGAKTSWWPWWRYAEPQDWGPEFASRLILESATSRVEQHPEAQEIVQRLVALASAVDTAVSTGA